MPLFTKKSYIYKNVNLKIRSKSSMLEYLRRILNKIAMLV